MARKSKSKRVNTIEFLEDVIENNVVAIKEYNDKRKGWALSDLTNITLLTEGQRQMVESYFSGNNIIASGSAGVGKSFLAIWLGLKTILDKKTPQTQLVIVRSPTTCKSIGFLPGTLEEKSEIFQIAYKPIVDELMNKSNAYESLISHGYLEFVITSYLRGITLDNCVVVFDEVGSSTFHEIDTVITRLGRNSKLIIAGDISQNDLIHSRNEKEGMSDLLKIATKLPNFDIINFTHDDIVRSELVKSWILAKEELGL